MINKYRVARGADRCGKNILAAACPHNSHTCLLMSVEPLDACQNSLDIYWLISLDTFLEGSNSKNSLATL